MTTTLQLIFVIIATGVPVLPIANDEETSRASNVIGHWRNYRPGRWEDFVVRTSNDFEWRLRYRMGEELITGTYRIRDNDRIELLVQDFQQGTRKSATPKLDANDRLLLRFRTDERGNLRLENVGVYKRRPYRLATFAVRSYVSESKWKEGVGDLLRLLGKSSSMQASETHQPGGK